MKNLARRLAATKRRSQHRDHRGTQSLFSVFSVISVVSSSSHTKKSLNASGKRTARATRPIQIALSLCLSFGFAARLGAQQTGSPLSVASNPTMTGTPLDATRDYVVSPDDELDVQVLDVPEASGVYRVSADGRLMLPLLSRPIQANGLTLEQLSDHISQDLQSSGMVSHPRVTINVKASRIHAITIAGAVKKPQIYPVFSKITLLDAISQAEGLADDAGDTAIITRGAIAKRMMAVKAPAPPDAADFRPDGAGDVTVDLKRLLEDGDPTLNVNLYPGDRVTVQRAGVVYVVGAVNKAGGFTLHSDRGQMTVLKAVALAEDLKSTAVAKKAVIIRKDPSVPGDDREIPVNVQKILYGHAPDQKLIANDILFIPDSAGRRALHRAGEAAAEAAALMAYRVP
jgi:polysaccharide biosynthesis/export protein